MNRFFVSKDNIKDDLVYIEGEDVKHIKDVLRLKKEDEIYVSDGNDNEYLVTIDSIYKEKVIGKIIKNTNVKRESNINITLYQGLPKSSKMDLIIQKATELGVKKIVPITMDRTVVKIKNKKKENKKLERYNRIALEAAKQSQRGMIPKVTNIISFEDVIENIKENDSFTIVPFEDEHSKGIKEALENIRDKEHNINIIIGPEGGFSSEEIKKIQELKYQTVTLGPRILRTETAGFTAIAVVMYELGDIGVV